MSSGQTRSIASLTSARKLAFRLLALSLFRFPAFVRITLPRFSSTDTQGSTRRLLKAARAAAIPRAKSAAGFCPSGKPRQSALQEGNTPSGLRQLPLALTSKAEGLEQLAV